MVIAGLCVCQTSRQRGRSPGGDLRCLRCDGLGNSRWLSSFFLHHQNKCWYLSCSHFSSLVFLEMGRSVVLHFGAGRREFFNQTCFLHLMKQQRNDFICAVTEGSEKQQSGWLLYSASVFLLSLFLSSRTKTKQTGRHSFHVNRVLGIFFSYFIKNGIFCCGKDQDYRNLQLKASSSENSVKNCWVGSCSHLLSVG